MIELPLTQGKVALIDDCDAHLAAFKWYAKRKPGTYYAARKIHRHCVLLHREILGAPEGMEVDHINGDGLDNRRENIRIATTAQNQANSSRRTDNSSGYKGVDWHTRDRRWRAYIHIRGKRVHLGHFLTPEDAARAYNAAAREHRGDFARLNFPIGGGPDGK